MRFLVFGAVAILTLTCCTARADTLPRIGVLPFDSGLTKPFDTVTAALPDIVTACFTRHTDAAEVVDRAQLDSLTSEATLNLSVQSAHYKSVNYLLRGSIFPHKEGISVNLMLYALSTGKLEASSGAEGMIADINAVTCRAVDALSQHMPVSEQTPHGSVTTEVAEKDRNMAEALGFYLGGAYERAIGAFLKLVKEDSTNVEAQYFLAKSYAGAGMNEAAHIEFTNLNERFPDNAHRVEVESFLAPPKGEQQ